MEEKQRTEASEALYETLREFEKGKIAPRTILIGALNDTLSAILVRFEERIGIRVESKTVCPTCERPLDG